jgi:AcrR family transcriptional regulator
MASSATNQPTDLPVTNAAIPEWKQQSVDRSLQAARARAQVRSDRFVNAALELMQEQGATDFTVQDVVETARMSIRTFYNFFASKDDLLVAVHQTILSDYLFPRLRERCAAEPDPVLRLRAYIEAIYELTSSPQPGARALTTYHYRLLETRPDELERASAPQVDLIVETIRAAADAGRLRSGIAPEKAAQLVHDTVIAWVHNRILGSENRVAATVDELWEFCASGIGADLSETPRR